MNKSRIEKIAKRTGKSIEEVEELFKQLKEQMKGKPERLIYNALVAQLRKRPAAPIERKRARIGQFIGFLIGDCGLRDIAEEMRQRAERVIDRYGFDRAKELGLVNEDGQVLDTRKTVFGRTNPNYGKPIPEDMHIRSHRLYLLAKEADGDKFELCHLQTNDNRLALAWCNLPFYTWVQFPALVQSHDTTGYRLTGSVAKETMTVFKEVKYNEDPFRIYEEFFKPQLTPIDKVEKYHEATKDAWDRWICVYGVVGYIAPERETLFGIPGVLLDPDLGFEPEYQVRFFVPDHLKINFGQYSEVYVFGRTRRSKYRDPETGELVEGDVVIDAFGLMRHPEYSTEFEEPEEEQEESIQGFLPLEE